MDGVLYGLVIPVGIALFRAMYETAIDPTGACPAPVPRQHTAAPTNDFLGFPRTITLRTVVSEVSGWLEQMYF